MNTDSTLDETKINKVKELLDSPLVNRAWIEFVNIGHPKCSKDFTRRRKAFANYTTARDLILGVTPRPVTEETTFRTIIE